MGQLPDLNAAAVFVKVVDLGSFRGAARALGLTKSSVSRRVAELEERLGARLLQRTTRHIGLTDAGAAYYRQAQAAVAALDDAERAVSALEAEPRGMLRVTMPINFGLLYLPAILRGFLKAHPEVQVTADLSDRQVDLVDEGFDVAIRAGALADSSLIAHRIGATPLWLFASPAYLRARGTPASPEELAAHDCLIFGPSSPAVWSFKGARGARQVTVSGRVASNNFIIVRDAALCGLGIARMPSFLGAEALAKGRLRTILDEHALPATPLHVVYPSARHLSPKVRAFVEYLRENPPLALDAEERAA